MGIDTNAYLYAHQKGTRFAYTVIEKETGRSLYGRETKEQLLEKHPDLEFLEYGEFIKRIEEYTVSEPHEITKEEFLEALNCLPPLNWYLTSTFECFHMSEFLVSHYTATYAHTAHRFFMWTDTVHATVDQIKEKLYNKFPELRG